MNFNPHYDLEGRHAFLSASSSSWIRYDAEKVVRVFKNRLNAAHGTAQHEVAKQLIKLRIKLPKVPTTLNMYVNDAIGFHMTPEVVLVASGNAFGTADAIWVGPNVHSEDKSRDLLRIHDLKTGEGAVKFDQLYIYAAFYCIEYMVSPHEIDMEFRIYQNDERLIEEGDPVKVQEIIDLIYEFDPLIDAARKEVMG